MVLSTKTAQAKHDATAKAKAVAPNFAANIGATEGKSPDRVGIFKELSLEVRSHAAAEEQALRSTMLRDPETTEVARHAISEHKEMDDMFADLAVREISSSGWLNRFAELKEEIPRPYQGRRTGAVQSRRKAVTFGRPAIHAKRLQSAQER